MSSKKKRKKNINIYQNKSRAPESTAEKITKQLNADDENPGQPEQSDDPEMPADSKSILEEYERQAEEAEQRRAERQRQAELAKAEKERRANTPAILPDPPVKMPEEPIKRYEPAKKEEEDENDNAEVKQFIPKESVREEKKQDSINDALSEEYDEFTGDAAADTSLSDSADEEKNQEKPNRFYLVFAVFVIIMSVIGVISTANWGAGIISDIANRTELKNEIALFLYPIVSVDPPDCDEVSELPSNIVVEAAIWRIILTGDNTNYEKQYNTYMYVPAIDVEFSVRSMFGNSVEIKHQTVGTMDISFTYIEDLNSYLVPINPHYTAYSPRITEVTNIGELYTVTVEYIPPSALAVEGIEFENTAAKTMVYTLTKSKNSATLISIKNITRYGNSNEY